MVGIVLKMGKFVHYTYVLEVNEFRTLLSVVGTEQPCLFLYIKHVHSLAPMCISTLYQLYFSDCNNHASIHQG